MVRHNVAPNMENKMYSLYIFDCFGKVVGNQNGYTTMRGANIALSKVRQELWARFDDALERGLIPQNKTLVYRVACK